MLFFLLNCKTYITRNQPVCLRTCILRRSQLAKVSAALLKRGVQIKFCIARQNIAELRQNFKKRSAKWDRTLLPLELSVAVSRYYNRNCYPGYCFYDILFFNNKITCLKNCFFRILYPGWALKS